MCFLSSPKFPSPTPAPVPTPDDAVIQRRRDEELRNLGQRRGFLASLLTNQVGAGVQAPTSIGTKVLLGR